MSKWSEQFEENYPTIGKVEEVTDDFEKEQEK